MTSCLLLELLPCCIRENNLASFVGVRYSNSMKRRIKPAAEALTKSTVFSCRMPSAFCHVFLFSVAPEEKKGHLCVPKLKMFGTKNPPWSRTTQGIALPRPQAAAVQPLQRKSRRAAARLGGWRPARLPLGLPAVPRKRLKRTWPASPCSCGKSCNALVL